jgi:hypothetical protein
MIRVIIPPVFSTKRVSNAIIPMMQRVVAEWRSHIIPTTGSAFTKVLRSFEDVSSYLYFSKNKRSIVPIKLKMKVNICIIELPGLSPMTAAQVTVVYMN